MKVIIDGVTYIPEKQEEKKQERLSGFVDRQHYINSGCTWINNCRIKTKEQTTEFFEVREGEIIVSEDDVRYALNVYPKINDAIRYLFFKKEGAL